jgi:hypothetical protein
MLDADQYKGGDMLIRPIVLSLVLAAVSASYAQFQRGTIVGTVTDETGAAIPSASASLRNVGTNERRAVTADERGEYTFPSLLPGRYELTVQRQGFKQKVTGNIELQVNQTARIDVQLAVGDVAERIEVAAAALLLKTDTSEVGHVINNKQIIELPLNGRDYLQLARLIPGAVPSRAGATAGQKGVNRSVNIGGARDTSMAFLLDGIDTNDVSFQTPSVTPSIDAIQEFKVLQNAYTAEFGRGSTQILTALKSGSNDWHGSLFEFLRNDRLAARSFFQPGRAAPLKQNQFGGTLGGPLVLPRLYNGKDRTFWFINYEGQRVRTASTGFGLVPTPEQLNGDFSLAAEPRIFDPATFDAATRTRMPFAGNRIPAARFSARAGRVTPLFQRPNFSGLVGRNYAASPAQQDDNNQGNLRVDQRLSSKDNFFARYSVLDRFRTRLGIVPLSGTVDDVRGQNGALNWVRVLSPALLNEVRFGFNRNKFLTPPEGGVEGNPARDIFGFTNTTTNPTVAAAYPAFGFAQGISGLGPGSQFPANAITQTTQFVDNVTWVRGAHSLKMGIDFRRTRLSQVIANNDRGTVTFTGQFTSQPGVANTGHSIADFLLGFPLTAASAAGDAIAHNTNRMYAAYFQDDWKVSSRLTLNLGARYEYVSPWKERLNQFTVVDPSDAAGRLLIAGTSRAFVPGSGVIDTGGPAISNTILRPDRNNWAPRVGFAWRPLAQSVVRGGYGIFFDVQEGNEAQFLRFNPPFFFIQNLGSDPLVPSLRLDNLFPIPGGPSGTIQPFSVDPSARMPYIQQWNLNIERELTGQMLLEIGYLGSKGTNLLRRSNFQQGANILVTDPARPAPLRDRVRFPNFSQNVVLGTDNGGSSTYHGFIVKVERRFSNGLAFLGSYTFSRTIDDTHSSSNFDNTPQNPQCRCDFRADKGLSAFHVQQRFVFSYNYELPLWKGRRLGGWQINGITAIQSGPPFTINTPGDNANIGTGSGSSNNQRPNLVGDPSSGINNDAALVERGVTTGTFYFNRMAYAMPPLFRLGNVGKNTLIGPGLQNWDFSVFKNTAIRERLMAQFRAEFFNLPNHPNFGVPGRIFNTPTFGVITGASAGRIVQFGLKIVF